MPVNTNIRILIVDDYQNVRHIIADILRAAGFTNTMHAENGKIAWRKIEEETPDLVFLDWDMPVMSGFELLNKIRGQKEYDSLPVIMLTAHNEQLDVLKAVESGVTDYIVKPFTPDTLYRKLESVLGGSLS